MMGGSELGPASWPAAGSRGRDVPQARLCRSLDNSAPTDILTALCLQRAGPRPPRGTWGPCTFWKLPQAQGVTRRERRDEHGQQREPAHLWTGAE